MKWISFILLSLSLTAPLLRAAEIPAEQLEFFEKEIRPLLAEHCYDCHSADASKLKGGLYLDSKWGWETGGDSGPAVVPGDLHESLVIDAVRRTEEIVSAMPPKTALSEAQIASLEKWVNMGAPDPRPKVEPAEGTVEAFDLQKRFEEHWCWRPVTKPVLPKVSAKEWPREELDHFILAKLEAAKLLPAEETDKRTWLRRVYLDLIGLPPTRDQIAAFLSDDSPEAYEKVVDELLASPHYGEKWARHWMDLVRYAETYGHEFDYPIRFATEYRDYLIRAFNADLPYDQFVTEHIAGDLLPKPRRNPEEDFNESIIGTGFWYFHEATHAPTDVLANEADIMDNQLDVFGKAFLGLTVACARCHDHKFDAISTKDYYALTGYLQSSARQEYPLDPGQEIAKVTRELEQLQKSASEQFREIDLEALRSSLPGPYFLASASLIRDSINQPVKGDPWAGEVFDDFESGYDKWTILEGTAFGEAPAQGRFKGQQAVTGFFGKGLINSFNGNDRNTGVLKSQPFTIKEPFINFLVGGGKGNPTAFELHIDGKSVRKAWGKQVETLEPQSWNVQEFVGKQAEFVVTDKARGGWGHINLDHIVFAKIPVPDSTLNVAVDPEAIAATAKSYGLDPRKLKQWVATLAGAQAGLDSPTSFLAKWIQDPKTAAEAYLQKTKSEQAWKEFAASATRMEDFADGEIPEGWFTTGTAFRAAGQNPLARFGRYEFATPDTLDSGMLGRKETGILRSPTFEIGKKRIHVRLRSDNITMRVVMDNYQMQVFQPLLFAGTVHKGAATNTKDQFAWISFDRQLDKYLGHQAYLEFIDNAEGFAAIDEIWLSDDPLPPQPLHPLVAEWMEAPDSTDVDLAAALDRSFLEASQHLTTQGLSESDSTFLNWMTKMRLLTLAELQPTLATLHKQGTELANTIPQPRYVIAMAQQTPEDAQVYIRGSHRNLGEPVPNRFLEALGGEQGSRLALAEEVTDPENPLTSRAIVNRLWHHLFGRGIVPSVDDFGPMGQEPTHPDLLDWLAQDLIDHDWSLKHSIRQIVLSSTYRQSSLANPELDAAFLAEADPTNALLHHMPVRRLPAEAIRDSILTVSGGLDPQLYGHSVPVHLTSYMTGRGRPGKSGPVDGEGRRSIYGEIRRNFLPPFLLTFDMPGPFGPKGKRSVSNVPAQALALLNDPFVIQQATEWAQQSLKDQPDLSDEARLKQMYEAATGQLPSSQELASLKAFLDSEDQPAVAWTSVAHVLFNTKEFLYLD